MKKCLSLLGLLVLTGCSQYQAKPLSLQPSFAGEIPRVTVSNHQLVTPTWPRQTTPAPNTLSMDQVAAIAVLNNATLKLARDDASLAQAQAFSAGLLPDPQFGGSIGYAVGSTPPGTSTAYSYGLSYDLQALLVHGFARKQGEAGVREFDLSLLWQEWQIVAQARILFVRSVEQKRELVLLTETKNLVAKSYAQIKQQLSQGNTTLDVSAGAWVSLQEVQRQINQLQQLITQTHHDLNLLLNLSPDLSLNLSPYFKIAPLNVNKINDEAKNLVNRRPDLLALRAGYESQDVKYRQAIFEQFPAITLGFAAGRDNSFINVVGPTLAVNIPIFNRNRGSIAIEKASRQRLYDDYQNRLNTAYSDIKSLTRTQVLLEQNLNELNAELVQQQRLVNNASRAFKAGDLDRATYDGYVISLWSKRIEAINLEQSVLEQRIALQALLGGSLPLK